MKVVELSDILIKEDSSIKDALSVIDRNARGICFVVDQNNRILGGLTDGDIRRALLRDSVLSDSARSIMNTNVTVLPAATDNKEILSRLNEKIKLIPLVDESYKVVDFATVNKIRRIPVATPYLGENELSNVADCIKTTWISSQGKYVRRFEEQFEEHTGQPKALAVSNGTVALHLALTALGIGPGDEVIVPDFTFAASINAIIYTGAKPVLADVDPLTWTLSIDNIKAVITPNTKAIMPVHLYGHPCDMYEIVAFARENKLLIIEDCAEALGSTYHGTPIGSIGDAATFSFFGNKTITTGEGGMVVFKDAEVAERAAVLRDHGMSKSKRYWHEEVGFNYRLTNIQAAIGVAQMDRLSEFVNAKRRIASLYNAELRDEELFILPPEEPWAFSSYWLYTIMVKENADINRDSIIRHLQNEGIESRPVFYPLHVMPPYQQYAVGKRYEVTDRLSASGISLPSSVDLDEEAIFRVTSCLKKAVYSHA